MEENPMTQILHPISNHPVTGLIRTVEWLANTFWDNRIKEVEAVWHVHHYDASGNFLYSKQVLSHLDNSRKVDEKGMRIPMPVLDTNGLEGEALEQAQQAHEEAMNRYNEASGQYDYWTSLLEKGIPYSQIMGGAVLELDKIGYWD
jgi:hypothetical protein